ERVGEGHARRARAHDQIVGVDLSRHHAPTLRRHSALRSGPSVQGRRPDVRLAWFHPDPSAVCVGGAWRGVGWSVEAMSDRSVTLAGMTLTTRMLTPETWDDFAALVEANNGVWGGCWCMGFHPEGVGVGYTPEGNRQAKRRHVTRGTVHQVLVYDGDHCVGWGRFGPRAGP